jgi:hypothetical protein
VTLTPRQLRYAQTVLRVGQSLGITPLGIQIALAVVFAESNWVNYANMADPASLNYPYDAIGSNGASDGLFQQTPPWWGTARCRMTPACAAKQFYTALAKLPYNSGGQTPGAYGQQVQRSAYPDRYNQVFGKAVTLYNQLTQGKRAVTSPATVLYGIDISNNNLGYPDVDLSAIPGYIAQLRPEGFSWVEMKCSQGSGFIDPGWPTVYSACQVNDLLVIPYHYADNSDATSQANNCAAALADDLDFVMIDFEYVDASGQPLLNIDDFWALVDAMNAAGITVAFSYIPKWYWREIGSPNLSQVPNLISSSWVSGSGYASVLYPGKSWPGWKAYGGATPVILQFTNSALVAGKYVDADAFQGTLSEFQQLLPTASRTTVPRRAGGVAQQLGAAQTPPNTADNIAARTDAHPVRSAHTQPGANQ